MNSERDVTEEQGGTANRSRPSSSSVAGKDGDNMKRQARQLIERYYYQITDGCGQPDCQNEFCASSSGFAKKNMTKNEAGLHAIELFKNKAKLCDSRPSKVARNHEKGPDGASASPSSSASASAASSSSSVSSGPSTSGIQSTGAAAAAGIACQSEAKAFSLDVRQKDTSTVASTSSLSTQVCNQATTITTPSRSRSSTVKSTTPAVATDTPHPPFLTEARLHEIIETCDATSDWSLMIRTIGSVFNNAESLMKSFRKSPLPQKKETQHWLEMEMDKDRDECEDEPMEASPGPSPFKLAPDEVTLDIESVRRSFKELFSISELPFLHSMINAICMLSKSVEVDLRYYQPYEIDPNYLNIFLIILEIPDLQGTEFLEAAFPKFCRALGCLPVKAQAKLVRVFARYPQEKLRDFLDNLQQLITVKTVSTEWSRGYCVNDDEGITGAAKVLKILFYACILAGRLDPPSVLEAEKQLAIDAEDHLNELLQGAVGREPKEKNQPKEDPLGRELGITPGDCREPAIPWEDFKNDSLSDAIEMDKDYTYYKAESESKFTFMTHSFLLTTAVKSLGLYFDNRIRMMNERRTSLLQSLVRGSPTTPYLRLRIRRDHIIDDSLVSLEMTAMDNPQDLKKQLYVEFEGEQGIDEGGVSKEFFQLVVEEIFNPDIGMFTYNEETRSFWFNPTSFENDGQFMLIGIVLGIAIYNNVILDVHFPMVVYRKLMGKKGTFEDLEFSHPTLHSSLKSMLEFDGDVENTFMQTFKIDYKDVFGCVLSHELKDRGDQIPVTTANRQEFVDLYADFLLNKSIEKQFKAFFRGFQMVTDESPLKILFRPEEIELLVCGSQNFDFFDLEKGAEYDGGFTAESQTIIDFWAVVHELSEEQKRKLLQFTTGSDRVPVGGLSKLKLIIAKNGPDTDRLPTSHTCFNVLLLPDYQNRAKLEERLLKAITYSKGFGML